MESGGIKMRFGRCPYCRTMIYQNPEAVIFFCSKCRTPIRGKNPVPAEEINQALSRLEILSVDSESVFSDELDACHNKLAPGVDIDGDQPPLFHQGIAPPRSSSPVPDVGFGSVRRGLSLNNGAPRCEDGFVDPDEQDELRRPFSRRTRRPSGSDSSVLRHGMMMATDSETEEVFSSPRNAYDWQRRRRRRSLLGSQAFEPVLRDPAFHNELVNALDNLRGLMALITAMELARSSSSRRTAVAPRDAHLFRQLESQLALALRSGTGARCRTGSSSSSSSWGYRSERRKNLCRPVLGAAPFLVCGGCSELLQAPATTGLPRGKAVRLRCGGCEEVLELPARAAGSAPQRTSRALSPPPASDRGSRNSGAQQLPPPQPLHRALGYSSPSPLLQSRRY